MKPQSQEAARRKYLQKASLLLVAQSPAISSRLRQESKALSVDCDDNTVERISSCNACGNVFVCGWSYKKIAESRGKRRRSDSTEKDSGKIIRLVCSRCNAVTPLEARKPPRKMVLDAQKPREDKVVPAANATPIEFKGQTQNEVIEEQPQPPRKRPRSKKATLQSMVSQQSASSKPSAPGLSLGLMDFMKT